MFPAAPSREDGFRHCALRKSPMAPTPFPVAVPGLVPTQPSPPLASQARARGDWLRHFFEKPLWRLQKILRGGRLACRQPPQCVNRRLERSGVGAGLVLGMGLGAGWHGRDPGLATSIKKSDGFRQPAFALAAAKAYRCTGERGWPRHHRLVC